MTELRTLIPASWAGGLVGLFLGYLWVKHGFASTFLVFFLGAVGYISAGVLRGEIDIVDTLARFQQPKRPF